MDSDPTIQLMDKQDANANINAGYGISPANAQLALKAQPYTNVVPSVGMQTPQLSQQALDDAHAQAAINHPAVSAWVASDPAKAAATKPDWHGMGVLADLGNYFKFGGMSGLFGAQQDLFKTLTGTPNQPIQIGPDVLSQAGYSDPRSILFNLVQAKFQQTLEKMGFVEPKTFAEKAAFTAGQFAPGALIPGGAVERAANVLAPAAGQLAGEALGGKIAGPKNAETGAQIGGLLGGLVGGLVPGFALARAGVRPDEAPIHQAIAETDNAAVASMQAQAANLSTHAEFPELTREYLDNYTGARDATAYVDPEKVVELQAQGHDVFPGMEQDIAHAALEGQDLEVPLGKYITDTAGKPYEEELRNASRYREDGVSVDEAGKLEEGQASKTSQEPPPSIEPKLPEDVPPEYELVVRTIAASADNAVDQVFKESGLSQLFADAKSAGMSKGLFERYADALDAARAELHDKLMGRVYDQIRRERLPEWKAEVDQRLAEHEQALAGDRGIKAFSELSRAKGPLGEPLDRGFKLSSDDQLSQYAKDLGLPKSMFSRDGQAPDEIAPELGYTTGADMVRDLARVKGEMGERGFAQYFKDKVRERATQAARDNLGFDGSPQGILDAAREAFNAPKVESLLNQDLQTFAKENGLPFDGQKVKAYARQRFEDLPTSRAMKPLRFADNMRRAGNRAEKALLDGDVRKAFLHKQQQLLNYHLMGEAADLQKRVARDAKDWRRIAKNVTMKNTAQDALNVAKNILLQVDERVKGNPEDLKWPINGHPSLDSFVAAKNNAGGEIVRAPVPDVGEGKTFETLRDAPVKAYLGVSDMLRSIMATGREEQSTLIAGKRQDWDEVVDKGIEGLNRYTKTITKAEIEQPTFLQKIERARRNVDAWLVRFEQLMRDFGGKDLESPFFQVVSKRFEDAKGWALDKRTELAQHFRDVNNDMGKGFDKWLRQKLPTESGPHLDVLTKEGDPVFNFNKDIVVAALHMGDEEGLRKFAEGWGTTPEHVEEIVHANATDQMWKFVEGMWGAFERLKPDIVETYKRQTGVTPKMVEARPFNIPKGGPATPRRMAGGYFPVNYDTARMPKDWVESLVGENQLLGDRQYRRATPANPYMKERTGVSSPVRMDLSSIHSRLNQVIHDLAYREPLRDAHRMFSDERLVQAISRKYGPEYVGKIRRNLERIARSESHDTNENAAVSKAVDWLTEGQMINMIGFSPTTAMKHGTTAVVQGLAEVGPARFGAAFNDYMRDVNGVGSATEAESPEVRHIISAYGEDSYKQFLALTEKTGFTAAYKRWAFHTIGFINKQVAITTYNAAKDMLAEKFPDSSEETIRAGANQIVRQALGSSGVTDAPDALSAGRGVTGRFYRLQNNFLTFLSHMYNKSREIPQNLGYAGEKVDLGRALGLTLSSIIIPVIIDQAIAKHFFMGVKSLGGFVGTLGEGLIHQFTAPVPGLNTVVAAGMHKMDHNYPEDDSPTASLGSMFGTSVNDVKKALTQHTWSNSATRNLFTLGGQVGHFPGLEASRLESFFQALAQGKEQGKGAFQIFDDALHGVSAKETHSRI